jgi:hypothetical protein
MQYVFHQPHADGGHAICVVCKVSTETKNKCATAGRAPRSRFHRGATG